MTDTTFPHIHSWNRPCGTFLNAHVVLCWIMKAKGAITWPDIDLMLSASFFRYLKYPIEKKEKSGHEQTWQTGAWKKVSDNFSLGFYEFFWSGIWGCCANEHNNFTKVPSDVSGFWFNISANIRGSWFQLSICSAHQSNLYHSLGC